MALPHGRLICGCGDAHEGDPRWRLIEAFVTEHGETVAVSTPSGSWMVPRAFIALHGIKAEDVGALAEKYGWKPA
jgi:hypothetical protein